MTVTPRYLREPSHLSKRGACNPKLQFHSDSQHVFVSCLCRSLLGRLLERISFSCRQTAKLPLPVKNRCFYCILSGDRTCQRSIFSKRLVINSELRTIQQAIFTVERVKCRFTEIHFWICLVHDILAMETVNK